MLQSLWDIVNAAETLDELADAEAKVNASDVSNEEYDELMNALAYKSREVYHRLAKGELV